MARISWAKKLTPTAIRVGKGGLRLGKRSGQRYGEKVLGLKGYRKARAVKRGAALAGLGAYAGYRHKKRMSSTLMS